MVVYEDIHVMKFKVPTSRATIHGLLSFKISIFLVPSIKHEQSTSEYLFLIHQIWYLITHTMLANEPSFYPSVDLALKYEMGFGHNQGLLSFLDYTIPLLPPCAEILDAGCGTGKPVAVSLAAAGHFVTGIDLSDAMISLSKKAIPTGHFHVVDMRDFVPAKGVRFDAIFNILSLFVLRREEIEDMMAKWSSWLKPGGMLCICTIAAEDLVPDPEGNSGKYDPDGLCARGIRVEFMKRDNEYTLFTRAGWRKMLADRGFRIKETRMARHVPPPEADCGPEDHYFIVAEKTS